jgi:hypothetical protein
MQPTPDPLDVQAHRRSLALQGIEMLSRLAEIGMQLAEGEGARALAAQAWAAEVRADPAGLPADEADPRIEAREAGLAFDRFARSVQRSLSLRDRAADRLCASDKVATAEREAGRKVRRARHRDDVRSVLDFMIWDEIPDDDRAKALEQELGERLSDLYDDDDDDRVEDRPVGSVMAGLACGLGLAEEWGNWAPGWPATPRPPRPPGGEASVRAERARRRDLAAAAVERAFPAIDPTRIEGIRAGLAVRLQEADMIECLDTETTRTVADRLCRSLGIETCLRYRDPEIPDTG